MALSQVSIKAMLDDLLLEIDIGALKHSEEFIKSLNDQFKSTNSLSEKQETVLRRIYRNHIGS